MLKASIEEVRKAINLEKPSLIPQLEYLAHPDFQREVSGIDPYREPERSLVETYKRLGINLVWHTASVDFPEEEEKKAVYHKTPWGSGESVWRKPPFESVEEVLSYSPLRAHSKTKEQRKAELEREWREQKEMWEGVAMVPGGIYTTLFMWGVETFGWELFMEAAASAPARFEEIMQEFFEVSRRDFEAYAEIEGIELFISHDDLAMASGPIFSPQWLEKNVISLYGELWKPLREKGIKVLFCSDGNYSSLVDLIAEQEPDGFIFESSVSMEMMVKKFGDSKILVGNIDSRVLTIGTPQEVREEVRRSVLAARDCPGYIINCTGHLPHNIPLENMFAYFDEVRKLRVR